MKVQFPATQASSVQRLLSLQTTGTGMHWPDTLSQLVGLQRSELMHGLGWKSQVALRPLTTHLSMVQLLSSLHTVGAATHPRAGSHTDILQGFEVSQRTGVYLHSARAAVPTHVSVVHKLLSSQRTGATEHVLVALRQIAGLQESVQVHAFGPQGRQLVAMGTNSHLPVARLQESAVQGLLSSHTVTVTLHPFTLSQEGISHLFATGHTTGVNVQFPEVVEQESVVHALASSQVLPTCWHPATGSQESTLHACPSSQFTAA